MDHGDYSDYRPNMLLLKAFLKDIPGIFPWCTQEHLYKMRVKDSWIFASDVAFPVFDARS